MDAISRTAAAQNNRIWIDAEQQILQHTIDKWTIDLMQRHNRNGRALIYNTLQAYLKESKDKLTRQLKLAHNGGWTLGIKLVRGAYISNEIRERIHDTKQDTDASYNDIVRGLMTGDIPGFSGSEFPQLALFLAGHNPESVEKATRLIRDLAEKGELRVLPEFGQLQGMADELGCKLLQDCENIQTELRSSSQSGVVPKVYKCLTWGSVQECMQYLVRRAVENHGSTGRMQDGMSKMARELRRRVVDKMTGRRTNIA
jgi:proline dehydrogenase